MSEPGRRPLKPLSPELAEPVRAFTEQLRRVHWDRTELNQRELAAALHLTKSPVSRYLNGQEIIPAAAFDDFCEIAGLTSRERAQLRRLRDRAEAAERGAATATAATPGTATAGPETAGAAPEGTGAARTEDQGASGPGVPHDAATPVPPTPHGTPPRLLSRPRTVASLGALLVLVLGAAVWTLTAVLGDGDGDDGGRPAAAPAAHSSGPGCRLTRVYRVIGDGDILDGHRHDIGDVHLNDVFTLDTPPAAGPYRFRDYGHVVGGRTTGYVDQAKLKPLGRRCVRESADAGTG